VRSQTAYLVVMMCMMAIFAVVRVNPLALQLGVGNLAVAGSLLVAGVATAMQLRYSFLIGMAAAAVTATTGALAAAGVRGITLPGLPFLWVVIGVYIGFRLTINLQHTQRAARGDSGRPRRGDRGDGPDRDDRGDGPDGSTRGQG
jgi:hypothetical protein